MIHIPQFFDELAALEAKGTDRQYCKVCMKMARRDLLLKLLFWLKCGLNAINSVTTGDECEQESSVIYQRKDYQRKWLLIMSSSVFNTKTQMKFKTQLAIVLSTSVNHIQV